MPNNCKKSCQTFCVIIPCTGLRFVITEKVHLKKISKTVTFCSNYNPQLPWLPAVSNVECKSQQFVPSLIEQACGVGSSRWSGVLRAGTKQLSAHEKPLAFRCQNENNQHLYFLLIFLGPHWSQHLKYGLQDQAPICVIPPSKTLGSGLG